MQNFWIERGFAEAFGQCNMFCNWKDEPLAWRVADAMFAMLRLEPLLTAIESWPWNGCCRVRFLIEVVIC